MKRINTTLALAAAMLLTAAPAALAGEPTCSDTLGIANHAQHVIGDYVTGIGHGNLDWPPKGRVGGGGGAAVPGGPGPGHFASENLAPGASFCTDRSDFTTPGPFTP